MVWQRLALNKSFTDMAENLYVHPSTVKRTVDRFEITGSVFKKIYSKDGLLLLLLN